MGNTSTSGLDQMASPGSIMLDDGSHSSHEEKINISRIPVTNSGSEIVRRLPWLSSRSSFVSGCTPTHTPAASDVGTATRKATTARMAELRRPVLTILKIGTPERGDTPRSPPSRPHCQTFSSEVAHALTSPDSLTLTVRPFSGLVVVTF